jgi:hypothetical protein
VKDDLVRVASLSRELALEQVEGVLGAGPREREIARGLLSHRTGEREDRDGGDDPTGHHDPTMSHCPASDFQHSMSRLSLGEKLHSVHLYSKCSSKSTLYAKFLFVYLLW